MLKIINISKIIFFLFFLSVLNANSIKNIKNKIINDIDSEFERDFRVWGVEFNKDKLLIRFANHNLLFNAGSSKLRTPFKIILIDFFPRFLKIIKKNQKYIDKIMILGHTSSENSKGKTKKEKFMRNLILSQERADEIYYFIKNIKDNEVKKNINFIKKFFEPIGYSSKYIIIENGKENRKKSRRIEILIKLKKTNFNLYGVKNKKINLKPVKEIKLETNTANNSLESNESNVFIIDDLLHEILNKSEEIQAQYQLLKSLKKDLEIEKNKYYPTLTVNARYDDYVDTTTNKEDTKYTDVTFKYNLFKGLQDYYAIKIKYLNYKVKVYEKDKLELKIILSALKAILNYKKYQELIKLSEDNLKDAEYIYNREKVKYENGMISLKDFAKIRSKIAQKKLDLVELKRQLNDYYSEILRYANVSKKDLNILNLKDVESEFFNNKIAAIKAMHIVSPVYKIQKGNVELYKTKYKAKRFFIYPTLDLIAQKSHNVDEFNDGSSVVTDDTKLTLNFSLPLFSGGKDYYAKQKAYYEYKQQVELDKSKVSELEYEIRVDYNALDLYRQKVAVLNDFIKAKEDAYVVANYDYKFNKIDSFGLMGIMDDLFNAKKQLIENNYQILNFKYKLLHDIGILKEKFFTEGK